MTAGDRRRLAAPDSAAQGPAELRLTGLLRGRGVARGLGLV